MRGYHCDGCRRMEQEEEYAGFWGVPKVRAPSDWLTVTRGDESLHFCSWLCLLAAAQRAAVEQEREN